MTTSPPPPTQVLAQPAPTTHLAPGERAGDYPDPTQLPPAPQTVRCGALLFHQVTPHPDDPPGLIRWCVQQPNGVIRPDRAIPRDELPHRATLHAVPNPPEPD